MGLLRRIVPPLLGVSGVCVAAYGQLRLLDRTDIDGGTWALIAGSVLAAVGVATALRKPTTDGSVPRSLEVLTLLVLLALGVGFRVAGFDQIPAGMNHDAAWNGMYATAIRSGIDYTPYVAAAWGRETLFMYVVAAFQSAWGTTRAALEGASIFTGVLALLPLYVLGRDLFGRLPALAGLGFFAVSGWHWVFSRAGWRCITVPPLEILSLLFLWRALTRGGKGAWLLTGAFSAASIYTYNAGRIVPAMVAVLALWFLVTHRERWRSILGGSALAAVSFLAVGGSMLWYAANNWVKFQGRAAHLLDASRREMGVLDNLSAATWMFNFQANGNDFFVTEPLLEPLAAVLFTLGGALLVIRIRRPEAQFVVLGFGLSLLPGLLSFPNGNRCITAMPFVYLAIGYGAAELARSVADLVRGPAARWIAGVLVLIGVGQAAVATYGDYLDDDPRPMRGFSVGAAAAGEFLGRFGEDYRTYAVSSGWQRYTLFYLGYTHGNPLEPDLVLGRSIAEVEGQISRYGKKGLVLVADMSASGREARAAIKRLFADAREVKVASTEPGGRELVRAVIVEPRESVQTAAWSNQSRVVEVIPDRAGVSSGSHCVETRPTSGGLSVRLRMMVPEVPASAVASVSVLSDCPDGAPLVTFVLSDQGLSIEVPERRLLVDASNLHGGRWHDLGFSVDAAGNARALADGAVTELGRPTGRPDAVAGLHVKLSGGAEGVAGLYVDDFAFVAESVPPDSRWWEVAPAAGDQKTRLVTFEGIPIGDVLARPGWHVASGRLQIRPGPQGEGGAALVGGNAFDGGFGDGPGEFNEPMGVGVDAAGNIFVTERMNHRVQKFSATGNYLGEWGVLGAEPGEFREPLDLAVEGDRVFVMDTWNTRLQIFDLTGNYVSQIGPDPILGKPRGIFVRAGKIYIANSGRDDILVYDFDGNRLARFPSPQDSTLEQIVDLVVDSAGRIYVNNSQHGRIEVFTPEGERAGAFAVEGWQEGTLREFYMAIDDDDVIYVGDWDLGRVRRFHTDGSELSPIGPRMSRPSGLALVGDRLIIAARGQHVLRAIEIGSAVPK